MGASSMQVPNHRSHQTRDGLTVYIGVIPAAIVKEQHPAGHPEATMHGGIPTANNEYHLVAAIFDAVSGERITDAKVTAIVLGLGNAILYGQGHMIPWVSRQLPADVQSALEPMAIAQTITYGGYFVLPKPARYTFQLTITRPDRTRPTVMTFVHDHRG